MGKKVKGRNRHILVDTLGLLLSVVHPADIQDRDGAFDLLRQAPRFFPFIERIYVDGGYRGEKMALVNARTGSLKIGDRGSIHRRPVRGPAQALDCRAHLRLDHPLSASG